MAVTQSERSAIRVVLADDHLPVLREVHSLLAGEFDVVASTQDGLSLVSAARKYRPDIVVTDIQMPGLDGIAAARVLLEEELCRGVIVLTMYADEHLIETARQAGIRGYVLKVKAGADLIDAVREVASGGYYLSQDLRSDAEP